MSRAWYISRTILLVSFFIAPFLAHAQVSITEIMYDLEGSDSGREWIEVRNEGSEPVDFTFWKFFENDTNHAIKEHHGGVTFPSNDYAIIADNAGQFLADNPGFSGIVFDSAFSLSNVGELLAIRDSALADVDSVTYQSAWGAVGDGTSLQEVGGEWKPGASTPGAPNSASGASSSTGGTGGTESSSGATGSGGSSESNPTGSATDGSSGTGTNSASSQEEKRITARIILPQNVVAGADALFRGEANGFIGEPLPNARFSWNFGDGATAEGKNVLHVYDFPGEYNVFLSASSGEFSATARARVSVETARITISAVAAGESGFIELKNDGAQDLDLSRWQIGVGEQFFPFPDGTILASHQSVKFGNVATGFVAQSGTPVRLYYPNAKVATVYDGNGQVDTQVNSPVIIIPPSTQSQKVREEAPAPAAPSTIAPSPAKEASKGKEKSVIINKVESDPTKGAVGDNNSEKKVVNNNTNSGTIKKDAGARGQETASAYAAGWLPAVLGGELAWWLALATLIAAGIVGAFLTKWRQPAPKVLSEKEEEADEYEIEEIEE